MTENNKIFIFQSKKKSIIGRFLDRLSLFSCLALSFYFNYKFIGGNDFFDVIIFSASCDRRISIPYTEIRYRKGYGS